MDAVLTEDASLARTPAVIIVDPENTFSPGDYVRVCADDRESGAIVERSEKGEPHLRVDKYLRAFLAVDDGVSVQVESCIYPEASSVEIGISPDHPLHEHTEDYRFLEGRPLTSGLVIPRYTFTGDSAIPLPVLSVLPSPTAVVTDLTKITTTIAEPSAEIHLAVGEPGITYTDIGGLAHEVQKIRELVEYPIRAAKAFARLGIKAPRGLILYGPPGTGKTLIARALSNQVGAYFVTIQGPEIMSAFYGQSERLLREKFEEANVNKPAVILIDELDAIAPKRTETTGDLEPRIVAQLLTLMDGLEEASGVTVIGTTNRIDAIDTALRRGGRFEKEIRIGAPDTEGRRQVLQIHLRGISTADDVNLDELADQSVGFVGADLAALCREAGYCALRRCFSEKQLSSSELDLGDTRVEMQDFREALKDAKPSALREFYVEIPGDVSWDTVGGLQGAKQLIEDNIIQPLLAPKAFEAIGVKPAQGALLYGPPGTGKTFLAKATARRANANFIAVRGPELESKWRGESERRLRELFSKARESAPCIIFFDEIDAISATRTPVDQTGASLINQLLAEMDGLQENWHVFIIGATNRVDVIDPALLRPGRFDYQIEVPLPDARERAEIFSIHTKPLKCGQLDFETLAEATDGFSGADIAEVTRRAGLNLLRQVGFDPPPDAAVQMDDFLQATDEVKKVVADVKPRRIGFER